MDKKFDELYKKEYERILNNDENEKAPDLVTSVSSWCLPSHIIVFLKRAIENIETRKPKLIPWQDFKKTIFDIFMHRA